MTKEPAKIFLSPCGAPLTCTCAVERDEAGAIILPDLNACRFTIAAHAEAIKSAREILEAD